MFGRTVNTAARVSDVTPPGELYLTEAAAAMVNSVPMEPVGAVHLESIGPTNLLRVVRRCGVGIATGQGALPYSGASSGKSKEA